MNLNGLLKPHQSKSLNSFQVPKVFFSKKMSHCQKVAAFHANPYHLMKLLQEIAVQIGMGKGKHEQRTTTFSIFVSQEPKVLHS